MLPFELLPDYLELVEIRIPLFSCQLELAEQLVGQGRKLDAELDGAQNALLDSLVFGYDEALA